MTNQETRRVARFAQRSFRCLLLVLLSFAARLPALQGKLIWDDRLLVQENPMIRSPLLIGEAFRHYLFPGEHSGHYRPVQTVSYVFDYLMWNTDTLGYHLTNVCLHVASAVLLYLLLEKLFGRLTNVGKATDVTAFLVAMIWAVHPVHSAAVDYISGRADCLAFVFAASAWLLYLRAREIATWYSGLYGLAAIATLLSLCSRESGFIWMLLFVGSLFTFEKDVSRRHKAAALAVCVLIAATYFGLRHLPESRPDPLTAASWRPDMRTVLMLRALGDYTWLLFFPINLHMERSVVGAVRVADWLAIGGMLTSAALVYGAIRTGPGQRLRRFGACWFAVSYLPISNLFTLNATVAEHWLYLPSVGFLVFLAGVAMELPPRLRRVAPALAGLAVLALAGRSAIRSSDWIDPETFFRRTFAAGGSNSRIGVNLAVIYAEQGQHAKAEAILRKVLQVSPNFSLARNNLALALNEQGKTQEGEILLRNAAAQPKAERDGHPVTWDAALHLAQMQYQQGNTASALATLADAKQTFPDTWELVNLEANIRHETDGAEASHLLIQSFALENWWHYGAAVACGRDWAERGELEQAEVAFWRASWLDVHDAEALNMLAAVKMRENRTVEALAVQERALARQPDQPKQYFLLASMFESVGRDAEAREALAQLRRLRSAAEGALAQE
jgi:Flp pilus assembly protein TadD